jgi:hypothetical protein
MERENNQSTIKKRQKLDRPEEAGEKCASKSGTQIRSAFPRRWEETRRESEGMVLKGEG